MKITALEAQKKAKGRVNVYVDGRFSFGINEKLLVDFDLYVGKAITSEEITKYTGGDSLSKCLDKAYRFLSFRPRSEKEMRDKLLEKYDTKTVSQAMKRLREYNFLNDADFARIWVDSRINSRGKRALSYELKRKGLEKNVIEKALLGVDAEKEYEAAKSLVFGKSKYHGLVGNEAYKKIAPFLSRRGYDYSVIKRVLDNMKK